MKKLFLFLLLINSFLFADFDCECSGHWQYISSNDPTRHVSSWTDCDKTTTTPFNKSTTCNSAYANELKTILFDETHVLQCDGVDTTLPHSGVYWYYDKYECKTCNEPDENGTLPEGNWTRALSPPKSSCASPEDNAEAQTYCDEKGGTFFPDGQIDCCSEEACYIPNQACEPSPVLYPDESAVHFLNGSYYSDCAGTDCSMGGSSSEQGFGNGCMAANGALRYGEVFSTSCNTCCVVAVCVRNDDNTTPPPDRNDTPPPFDCAQCAVNSICLNGACIPIEHPDDNGTDPTNPHGCDSGYFWSEFEQKCIAWAPDDNHTGGGGENNTGGDGDGGGDTTITSPDGNTSKDANLTLPKYKYVEQNYGRAFSDVIGKTDYVPNVPLVTGGSCDVTVDIAGISMTVEFSKYDSYFRSVAPFIKYAMIFGAIWAVMAGGI